MDSTYYDAYLGLGIYNYYADLLPGIIKSLSFITGIHGDKKRGLAELDTAIQKSTITTVEAQYFKSEILLDYEKQYTKAVKILENLRNEYPEYLLFSNKLAEGYKKTGQYTMALKELENIVNNNQNKKHQDLYYRSCYEYGNLLYLHNDFEQLLSFCNVLHAEIEKTVKQYSWIYPIATYYLAECYAIMGKNDSAIVYYKEILKKDHEQIFNAAQNRIKNPLNKYDIILLKVNNCLQVKNYTQALVYLNEILTKELTDTSKAGNVNKEKILVFRYLIAYTKFEIGNYDEAINIFTLLIDEQNPTQVWIKPYSHFYIANCFTKLNNSEKAKYHYDRACDTNDKKIITMVERARKMK